MKKELCKIMYLVCWKNENIGSQMGQTVKFIKKTGSTCMGTFHTCLNVELIQLFISFY